MSDRVRADLREACEASLDHVVTPGARFDGARRRHLASIALDAFTDPNPAPPWARPHGDPAADLAVRVARHAGTLTEAWYHQLLGEGLDPLEWVETVGVVVAAIVPAAFARAAGLPIPALSPAQAGPAHGRTAADVVPAEWNWVPVGAPADARPAVVQALSALPGEWENMWRLADALYMPDAEMVDPTWTRGTLSRPQMELVASRLAYRRECFY